MVPDKINQIGILIDHGHIRKSANNLENTRCRYCYHKEDKEFNLGFWANYKYPGKAGPIGAICW